MVTMRYKTRLCMAILSCIIWASGSWAQTITTVAGGGASLGDGGPATSAQLNLPRRSFVDATGNIYIPDSANHRLRKVDATTGIITTIAGTGSAGFSGDGGPATSAQFSEPNAVYVSGNGYVYISDRLNGRVRVIDPSGIISTLASGLNAPSSVFSDGTSTIYVAETDGNRILSINAGGGVSTVAGTGAGGFSGDGGPATSATLNSPRGVSVDGAGNIYIADAFNQRIRKVDSATGIISTVAGTGSLTPPNDGGPATSGNLWAPNSIFSTSNGTLYISTHGGQRIRRVDGITGIITTVAGTGAGGFSGDGGPATSAALNAPHGVFVDAAGDLYISDMSNNRIRKVNGVEAPTAQPLTVTIPDTTATYNQAIDIPVGITDTNGHDIVSAELFVTFTSASSSGSLLTTFSPAVTAGSLTTGWTIESNVASGGASGIDTLKIAMATDTDTLSGAGTLAVLRFSVADQRAPNFSALTIEHLLFNDGSPTATEDDGSVTLVGTDGALITTAFATGSSTQLIPGDTVEITYTDIDENRDGGFAETLSIAIANGAQTETVTVTETGLATGIFTGSIATAFSLGASSGDGTIQAQAGDTIQSCADDSLDSVGATVQRCATLTVIGGEDGSISTTIVTQPGDTLRVRVTDADLNTSFSTAQTVTVTVTNPTTGESETITLTEIDADDSIFFGIVETASGATAGTLGDGALNTAKGDVIAIDYADVLTAQGGSATRSDDNEIVDPFGDADGNGNTQAFDAAKVLLHVLSPYLTGVDSLSANLDLLAYDPVQGRITPFDAALILQKRVGLISRFPVQEDEADNHPQPETDNSTPKLVPDQRYLSFRAEAGYVSVWMDQREGLVAGDLVIQGVEGTVEMGEEMGDFLTAARPTDEGLHLVFAGAQSVTGAGEVLRLYGVGPEGIRLVRAQLNDGRIAVHSDALEAATVPTTFALHANVPNPFNPETTIRFDLPQASRVALEVYDMLGQKVRTLVDQPLSAGAHQVRWDGRNTAGSSVASGVYFYRIQAQEQTLMQRMLLLK